jgi:hypothetical protein
MTCTLPAGFVNTIGWFFILSGVLSFLVAHGFTSEFVTDDIDATFSGGEYISIIAVVYSIAIGILTMMTKTYPLLRMLLIILLKLVPLARGIQNRFAR